MSSPTTRLLTAQPQEISTAADLLKEGQLVAWKEELELLDILQFKTRRRKGVGNKVFDKVSNVLDDFRRVGCRKHDDLWFNAVLSNVFLECLECCLVSVLDEEFVRFVIDDQFQSREV